MTALRTADPIDCCQDALDLAGLHACRTKGDLDRALTSRLVRWFPATDMALCLADEDPDRHRVALTIGTAGPWRRGDQVDVARWNVPPEQRFVLHYLDHELGVLLLGAPPAARLRRALTTTLTHYGVALVNLTLNHESRRATDHYCASLQALEQGIVLFQESDPETVMARLMGLATTMLRATAGALYVLDEVGKSDSPLRLSQTLGVPDALLQTFRGQDGSDWPRSWLRGHAFFAQRRCDPTLGGLEPSLLPPILQNVVSLPLRYHGIDAGVCMVFNVAAEATTMTDQLEGMDSLCQLGAALLHRLSLEATSARNRAIEQELAIAETIQKRLLPSRAPATPAFDFAWRSLAAQTIGGDYLDLLTAESGQVHALIADASGHGINSALLMSAFRAAWRGEAPWVEPHELLSLLNREVHHEVGATGMFITAATLRLEPATLHFCVANAGHNPPLWYRAATGTVERIAAHGPPLGFMAEAGFGSEQLVLERGDILLLYTDGVTEAADRELELFGDERLERLLASSARGTADEILDRVLAELQSFSGRARQDDDVSLSIIKVR